MIENEETEIFAGVDVGGTNIKIGFVSDGGEVLLKTSIPTESERGPQDAIDRIAEAIERTIRESEFDSNQIVAIGLGTPGTMDIPKGMILEPPNLPAWRHFPVRDKLSEATGKPVTYANDANAAAFGEYWIGSGRQFESMVLLTLGTGVGGGIIVFDRTIDGVNSHGAEIGHTIVDASPDARVCSCGSLGHLEAYASATAVVAIATESIPSNPESLLAKTKSEQGQLTALAICEAAENGDELAIQIVEQTADHLAVGILNVAHTIDPEAIVLGGAMNFGGTDSPIGQRFLDRIRSETKRLCLPVVAEKLTIDFASLGGDAGFIGAAGIARSNIRNRNSNVEPSGI